MTTNLDNPADKDTKQFLLEVSFKVFISKEYGQVTFDYLTSLTEYTKGIFFYYFENKTDLYCQMMDKYFFSRLNPQYPIHTVEIKSFNDFLKHKIRRHIETNHWFHQNGIEDNPFTIMQHLFAQAVMRYPNFKTKYKSLSDSYFKEWHNAIEIGKKSGEIPLTYDTDSTAICLDALFQSFPFQTAETPLYNNIFQALKNMGILNVFNI